MRGKKGAEDVESECVYVYPGFDQVGVQYMHLLLSETRVGTFF